LDNPAFGSKSVEQKTPTWLLDLEKRGYCPYIATSDRLLPYFNTKPFGRQAECYTLENPKHEAFHEAYLLSNALSFQKPDIKMPHWVLVDCVLMQTAIVGFTKQLSAVPDELLKHYKDDPTVDVSQMSHLPVSGQIASLAADGKSVVGLSLFSLAPRLGESKGLGLYTKALALEVYKAQQLEYVYGITQYDNRSLAIHGRFAKQMEIYQPMVQLHPFKDMTFIYRMTPDYNAYELDSKPVEVEPTFWLNATDKESKLRMQEAMTKGKRFIIAPPFIVKRDGQTFLPIIEKDASK